MRSRIGMLLLAMVAAAGCQSLTPGGGDVSVRVRNFSTVAFDSVLVKFPREEHRYGALPAGAASEYRSVREAYRYDYVEVWVGGQQHVVQPIDFVGESLLPPGRYTYGLTFEGNPPQLSIIMADDPRVR